MFWLQNISSAHLALENMLVLDLKIASIHMCSSQIFRAFFFQTSPAISLRTETLSSKRMSLFSVSYLPVHHFAFLNTFSDVIKIS